MDGGWNGRRWAAGTVGTSNKGRRLERQVAGTVDRASAAPRLYARVIMMQLLFKSGFSPLRAGIVARLAIAGGAACLLWLAVIWALL